MTRSTKQKTLIILGLVMLMTFIIAASLSRLELQPGMPLPRLDAGQIVAAPRETWPLLEISVNKFLMVFFGLILAGSTIYMLYMLFKGADWKTLTSFIPMILGVSVVMLGIVFFILMIGKAGNAPPPPELLIPPPAPPPTAPLGPVPPIILWIVGICLALTGIIIGIWSFNATFRKPSTLDTVGLEAELAWKSLQNGVDLKDVILKCYQQMSLALEEDQGVERENFMTAREFESALEKVGMPHDPVHQLTRLFEAVRYGHWQPNSTDEQKAIQSLGEIVKYSREAKNKKFTTTPQSTRGKEHEVARRKSL